MNLQFSRKQRPTVKSKQVVGPCLIPCCLASAAPVCEPVVVDAVEFWAAGPAAGLLASCAAIAGNTGTALLPFGAPPCVWKPVSPADAAAGLGLKRA